jgi:SPP1 family predicted phage head-tail adaptor
MRIGRHDRKITIRFRTLINNVYGEAVPSYSSTFAVWARLEPKTTGVSEGVNDGIETNVQRAVFLIRYSTDVADVTGGDQVQYNGKIYDIENVQEQGRNTSLRLFCKLVE